MRTVCIARWTSQRKNARPITRTNIAAAKNTPMSHFSGVCSMTSTKRAAITTQTDSAAIVVAVIAISRATGALAGEPEVIARGYVVDEGQAGTLFKDAAKVIGEAVEASSVEERTDQGLMTEKVRVELRRFFKKRSGRRPLVLPVLMEI